MIFSYVLYKLIIEPQTTGGGTGKGIGWLAEKLVGYAGTGKVIGWLAEKLVIPNWQRLGWLAEKLVGYAGTGQSNRLVS